jgi:hypothetical protein
MHYAQDILVLSVILAIFNSDQKQLSRRAACGLATYACPLVPPINFRQERWAGFFCQSCTPVCFLTIQHFTPDESPSARMAVELGGHPPRRPVSGEHLSPPATRLCDGKRPQPELDARFTLP